MSTRCLVAALPSWPGRLTCSKMRPLPWRNFSPGQARRRPPSGRAGRRLPARPAGVGGPGPAGMGSFPVGGDGDSWFNAVLHSAARQGVPLTPGNDAAPVTARDLRERLAALLPAALEAGFRLVDTSTGQLLSIGRLLSHELGLPVLRQLLPNLIDGDPAPVIGEPDEQRTAQLEAHYRDVLTAALDAGWTSGPGQTHSYHLLLQLNTRPDVPAGVAALSLWIISNTQNALPGLDQLFRQA